MSNNYEAALKGTREEAESALEHIHKQIMRYGKCGEDASKYQLKFSLNTLRSMCVVAATPKGTHYDLYCDMFERILAPHIEPSSSPPHWERFLECMRYFHYLMIDKKLYGEASKVFNYVAGQANKLQNETDYKIILNVYSQHLLTQRTHLQCNEKGARKEIENVMTALKELFTAMLVHNSKDNFIYPELSADFVQCLMPKRTANIFGFLSTLPTNKTQMYDIFFILLAQMKMPHPAAEDLGIYWQRQLETLCAFLHFDVADKLQHQLALQHLRACRDQRVLQADKAIGHIVTLLYNYVKLLYSRTPICVSFGNTFVDLCGKFTSFFEKSGEVLITQHKWFMDVLVFLNLLLTQTQHHSLPFDVFWRQINSIECYTAFFELTLCCIKLAPRITESKLAPWTCCTSVRKHTITGFMTSALSAYDTFVQNMQVLEKNEKAVNELNKSFTMIMRHGVRIIDSMICITPTSSDLKMFYALFANLTRNVRTSAQALFCCTLAEVLVKIQNKFARNDWTLLVRRLYKTASLSDDKALATDLQVCYIASILTESPQAIDLTTLRNQIGIFYTLHGATMQKCLLEWNEQSKSVFRPLLGLAAKRLLHWLEAQQYGKYFKTNVALQASLMRCSVTLYDEVLIARVNKLSIDAAASLERICKKVARKSRDSVAGARRLDQLVLAHARTALMLESYAIYKNTVTFETKECQEESLDELLIRKEFGSICLTKELKWVAMAQEAVNAFEEFYSRADLEHISSDDACIDWEVILDDVAALASFLHLSGYMEHATAAWLLYYRIANTIDDQNSALRALAFFCEQAEYFENDIRLNVQEEINKKQPHILNTLDNLVPQLKRNQNYALLCLCHMSYFYARSGNLSYAQILLQLVEQKHQELVERQGKYDLVLGAMETVKFRILWKHLSNETDLMQCCLLREVEMTLERFRDFVYIASGDTISYTILILSLIQQIAECTANRLCDNFVNGFFVAALKMALSSGLALRLVQILSMWMLTNLQMEHVKKAQTKLKLIEFVMGTQSLQQLQESNEEAMAVKKPTIEYTQPGVEIVTFNPGMETMRKVAQVHFSPVNMEKLRLSPTVRNCALNRFLQYDNNEMLHDNEVLQWNYFTVGCLNARLYFLVDDYKQLDGFYENCAKWFEQRENKFLLTNYQNIQLLCMQHYANYLRANKNYEKAIKCIENALTNCGKLKFNVDSLYRINLMLQLRGTKIEMSRKKEPNRQSQSLRRALEFDVSPPEDRCEKVKSKKVEENLLLEAASVEKMCSNTAFIIYNSENDAIVANVRTPKLKLAKMRKPKFEKSSNSSSDSSCCNSVPDVNSKDDLNVCQIIDSSSDTEDGQATVVERKAAENKQKQSASVGSILMATCKQRTAAQREQLKSQRNNRGVPPEPHSNDGNEIRIQKTITKTVKKTVIVKGEHVKTCDAIEIIDNSDDSDIEIVNGVGKSATATIKEVKSDIVKEMKNIEITKTTKIKTTNTKILKPHAPAKQVVVKDSGSGVRSPPKTYLARTRGRLRKVDSTENNENVEPVANAPVPSAATNNVGRRRRQKT